MLRHQLLIISAVVAISACDRLKTIRPPEVKQNPSPKNQFEVTLSLIESPGDVSHVTARMNYKIANADCVPIDYTRSLGGSTPTFRHSKELPIITEDKTYAVSIAEDQIQPEDYYGRGVCRWEVDGIAFFIHRGSVTNVAHPRGGYRPMHEMDVRLSCTYKGNSANNGLDICFEESVAIRRSSFPINVSIRRGKGTEAIESLH